MVFSGNRTECALLLLTDKTWGLSYEKTRHEWDKKVFKLYGFTSARKMASVVIEYPDKYKVYNKGAAEWVLQRCSHCWQAVSRGGGGRGGGGSAEGTALHPFIR